MLAVHRTAFLGPAILLSVVGLSETPLAVPGEPLILTNKDLTVAIRPREGQVEVKGFKSKDVWKEVSSPATHPFRNVEKLTGETVRFRTTFDDAKSGTIEGTVELRLRGRDLTMVVNLDDPKTRIGGFLFLPPFQPVANSDLAVADYTDGHLYPCNLVSWPLYNLDQVHVSALDMPWIGVSEPSRGVGYSVMVDTPFDASFQCRRVEGLRAPWVRWEDEKGIFGYARSLTYHFAESGGYVELAKAFRSRTQLGKLAEKAKQNPNIRKLYGAPELWDFFDDVSDSELRALGVAHCLHHVQTWTDHGDAVNDANRLGYVTEDYDYYLQSHPASDAHPYLSGTSGHGYYDTADHLAVEPDGKPRGEGDWWYRCPTQYATVARKIIPARLAKFPSQAIYFDQITADFLGVADGQFGGGSLEECWSTAHPATRTQWKDGVLDFLGYVVKLGAIPAAEHGKWWEVPYTSVFYGIPSVQWPWPDVTFPTRYGNDGSWELYRKWGSVGHENRVPLWELVYHDSSIAMWYPWDTNDITVNIPNDWMQEDKDANSVLYGIPSSFMVNGKGTGSWFVDRAKFLTSYRDACKIHEELADKEMLSHAFLTADRQVQETRWSDGTRIVVNFGSADYRLGKRTLKRFGWVAKGPWGEASKVWAPSLGRSVRSIRKSGYAFSDVQSAGERALAVSVWRVPNAVQVNVDDAPEGSVFAVDLSGVNPSWRGKRLHAFLCDSGGTLLREVPTRRSGSNSLQFGPLSGWIQLDLIPDDVIRANRAESRSEPLARP